MTNAEFAIQINSEKQPPIFTKNKLRKHRILTVQSAQTTGCLILAHGLMQPVLVLDKELN